MTRVMRWGSGSSRRSGHCASPGPTEMRSRRLLTIGPDNESLWVRLYVRKVGDAWAAMIVADEAIPPGPGELKGMHFLRKRQKVQRSRQEHIWGCPSQQTDGRGSERPLPGQLAGVGAGRGEGQAGSRGDAGAGSEVRKSGCLPKAHATPGGLGAFWEGAREKPNAGRRREPSGTFVLRVPLITRSLID